MKRFILDYVEGEVLAIEDEQDPRWQRILVRISEQKMESSGSQPPPGWSPRG